MTNRSSSFALVSSSLSLLTTLLLACGGSVDGGDQPSAGQGGSSAQAGAAGAAGSSGHAGAPPAATLEQACRAFFARRQEQLGRCGPGPGPEPASVEPAYVASCVGLASLPGATVTPEAIAACAAAMPASGCELPACALQAGELVMPAADRRGTRPTGASCEGFTQCASGLCTTTWLPPHLGGRCGVCQETRGEGQSCADPQMPCQGEMICQDGVCAWPGQGPGEPCESYGDGCRHGFYCATPPDSISGTCQARVGSGHPCDPFQGPKCGEDLACVHGLCTPYLPDGASCDETTPCHHVCRDGVCRLPRRDAQVGEDCAFDMCALGLDCTEGHVCQVPDLAFEGQDCSYHRPCAPGLLCSLGYLPSAPAGRCVREPAPGEPCADLRCGPLAVCENGAPGAGEPGQCRALGFAGQPCPCLGELLCVDGVCQPIGAVACE